MCDACLLLFIYFSLPIQEPGTLLSSSVSLLFPTPSQLPPTTTGTRQGIDWVNLLIAVPSTLVCLLLFLLTASVTVFVLLTRHKRSKRKPKTKTNREIIKLGAESIIVNFTTCTNHVSIKQKHNLYRKKCWINP